MHGAQRPHWLSTAATAAVIQGFSCAITLRVMSLYSIIISPAGANSEGDILNCPGDDGFDAFQRLGLRRIDRLDDGVGVRV